MGIVNQLGKILTSPSHVFGCHQDCKAYYCRFVQSNEKDTDHLQDLKTKAPTVWALICAAKEAVMSKCHRLSNDTTNVVENFMSVLSKFICGKRLNLHKGGSYQRRLYVAGKNLIIYTCYKIIHKIDHRSYIQIIYDIGTYLYYFTSYLTFIFILLIVMI